MSVLTELKRGKVGYGLLIERDGVINPNSDIINEIKDNINNNSKIIVPDNFEFDAIMQKHSVKNGNGRIYPKNILEREVEKYKSLIKDNLSYGESDHPQYTHIQIDRISHLVTDIYWEKNTVLGKFKLLVSKAFRTNGTICNQADIIANIIIHGGKIGCSSRGVGSVEKNTLGDTVVQDDFDLISWDIVVTPSTPMAFLGDKLELSKFIESKEVNRPIIREKIDRIRQILL